MNLASRWRLFVAWGRVAGIVNDAKDTPFLWFDSQAEEAAKFYCSVFQNSKIKETTYYTGDEPMGEKEIGFDCCSKASNDAGLHRELTVLFHAETIR